MIDLENKFQRLKPFHGNEQDMYEKICELEIFLGKSPAADVVPVVHGKNVTKMHPVDEFICSVCGFDAVDFNRYDSEEDVCYEYECKYCPNCGAKMDLEEEQ